MPTAEPDRRNEEEERAPSRAMQIVSVRFGRSQKALIDTEAEAEGVSTSQFIRDSAYGRAVVYGVRRQRAELQVLEAMMAFVEEYGSDKSAPAIEEALRLMRQRDGA